VRSLLPIAFLAFLACGDDAASPSGPCPDVELFVAASDYQSSVACGAPGCFEEVGRTTALELGGDPMLQSSNGKAFFLARDRDTVFSVDACGIPTSRASVASFGVTDAKGVKHNANPHDVAALDDGTLMVLLYTTPQIVFLKDGQPNGAPIELGAYDDDGNPQAESLRIVNGKAFVALERLDDDSKPPLQSKRGSQMLRIDVATRTVETAIDLAGRNPFNAMAQSGTFLYLAEPNNTDIADEEFGGIERFDTATSTTRMLVHEHDLGASVMEVAVTDGCGAAIVAGPVPKVNPTALVTFDPESGAVLTNFSAPVLATPGFDLQGLVWRDGKLYLGDRRRGSNGQYQVHEFARTNGCILQATGKSIDLPQPPVGLQAANPP
jgi:hypothetical protein